MGLFESLKLVTCETSASGWPMVSIAIITNMNILFLVTTIIWPSSVHCKMFVDGVRAVAGREIEVRMIGSLIAIT